MLFRVHDGHELPEPACASRVPGDPYLSKAHLNDGLTSGSKVGTLPWVQGEQSLPSKRLFSSRRQCELFRMTVPHRAEQNKYPMYDYLREWGHNKGSSHINQLHKQPMETAGFTKLWIAENTESGRTQAYCCPSWMSKCGHVALNGRHCMSCFLYLLQPE